MQLRDRQEGLGGEVKGQMASQLADYQSQLTAIQHQLAAFETSITTKDERFAKTLADFSQLHSERLDNTRKELNESIQQLQRQLGKTRGDWLIADAEYLLSVANERLHLVGDINTTREALEAADQRLRESGDAGVIKVREQIAKDLAVIRNLTAPDVVGLYAALQGMESLADKLTLELPYAGKPLGGAPDIHDHAKATEADSEEHGLLQSAMGGLHGLVTIRHSDQSVKEILTPEEAQFIREQLRVKLEMVKVALVEHNEPIYQASLSDAKNWLEQGQRFARNEESKNFAAELDRLAGVKIRSQFPDISLSFKMLRDIAKLRLETDKGMKTEADGVTPSAQPTPAAVTSPMPATPVEPAPTVQPEPASPAAPTAQPMAMPEHPGDSKLPEAD